MKIVADANISCLDQTFGKHGRVRKVNGRNLSASDLHDAEVLLVRSVTRVDRDLLHNTGIKFVGTATIGTDHLDINWLNKSKIRWESAPGCNADAAAQYTLAMLLLACERLNTDPRSLNVGIIGRGNVGSRLMKLLSALEVKAVTCDPPLADQGVSGLVSTEEALSQDIVCVHVPLTKNGLYPTWQMINRQSLGMMKDGAILINSSRGDVVEGQSLEQELRSGRLHAALDVWPGEPGIDPALLKSAIVATPHVAGYSKQGRQNGTHIIYRKFLAWAGNSNHVYPTLDTQMQRQLKPEDTLFNIIREITHIVGDDQSMRELISMNESKRRLAFDGLRKSYQFRNDFSAWNLSGGTPSLRRQLSDLGFQ